MGTPNGRVEQLDHYGFRIAVRPKDVEARKKCEEKARRRAERSIHHFLIQHEHIPTGGCPMKCQENSPVIQEQKRLSERQT